jgi:hypothetical protein
MTPNCCFCLVATATATVLELGPMASRAARTSCPCIGCVGFGRVALLLGAKATKIDGFRDASPGRPAATAATLVRIILGLAQEGRDALPCDAEALPNLLHRQALGVERARLGPAYVRSALIERR